MVFDQTEQFFFEKLQISVFIAFPKQLKFLLWPFSAFLFKIQGTTASAGFGITGLAGPINAYSFMETSAVTSILILLVQYLVVPLGMAILTHTIFTKMGLYEDKLFTVDSGEEEIVLED